MGATTSQNATFKLKTNGNVVNSTSTGATSYNYSYTVTQDALELEGTSTINSEVQPNPLQWLLHLQFKLLLFLLG